MEPRIQYTKTSDGVSIAYWTLGEGTPATVVVAPLGYSHISLECAIPELMAWYERLASHGMLIRYDPRGQGMSQRDCQDLTPELLDIEAVIDELGLERVNLVGHTAPGAMLIEYAARHADMVDKLVLWSPILRGSDFVNHPRMQAVLPLLKTDYDLFIETWAHVSLGWSARSRGHGWAAFIRESIAQEDHIRLWQVVAERNLEPYLAGVAAETLILTPRSSPLGFESDHAKEIAAGIPNARLVVTADKTELPYWESPTGTAAVEQFLFGSEEASAEAAPPAAGDVHTILFTDMEGSTALAQRLGDARAQDVRRAHNTIVRDALRAEGGSEIKHTGDGIMASFPSASHALACAVAIQRAVAALRQAQGDQVEARLSVRIGLNAGEPVVEEDDLFGTSVDLAKRICDHAEPGEILVSDVVRQLAAGKDFLFSDRGEVVPKGFDEAVRLYTVRWEGQA
ncbi:MAG: adenylate/guanylate cyclase domain-containing protein [Chloroflexi bacterium]|nr:adenylate/guanylate cyclase domain-containing protein [Chloroflexota bacterium]